MWKLLIWCRWQVLMSSPGRKCCTRALIYITTSPGQQRLMGNMMCLPFSSKPWVTTGRTTHPKPPVLPLQIHSHIFPILKQSEGFPNNLEGLNFAYTLQISKWSCIHFWKWRKSPKGKEKNFLWEVRRHKVFSFIVDSTHTTIAKNVVHLWIVSQMAEVTQGQTKTSLQFAHLALHHPQLLTQVAVDFKQLLYFGFRCSEGALHLHELLHGDWSIGEVGRLRALQVTRKRQGEVVFQDVF